MIQMWKRQNFKFNRHMLGILTKIFLTYACSISIITSLKYLAKQ